MFCTNCGTQIEDGAKFCTQCGAKVDGTAPQPPAAGTAPAGTASPAAGVTAQPALPREQSPIPGIQETGMGDTSILNYTISNNGFHVTDTNGKIMLAEDAFKKSDATAAVIGALLGVTAALAATQWLIKVQIYKNKICFTRLNMIGRPTDSRIEIMGQEIVSATKTNTFTLFNKTEVTIVTHSWDSIAFDAPKKKRDDTVNVLLDMISRQ
jgi:hypothetical protein